MLSSRQIFIPFFFFFRNNKIPKIASTKAIATDDTSVADFACDGLRISVSPVDVKPSFVTYEKMLAPIT